MPSQFSVCRKMHVLNMCVHSCKLIPHFSDVEFQKKKVSYILVNVVCCYMIPVSVVTFHVHAFQCLGHA